MITSILDLPFYAADKFGDRISHKTKKKANHSVRTFRETAESVKILAAGFSAYGVSSGDHVGFFVNNRYEWILTDFALMGLKAVTVPRGSDTTPGEVKFIFNHSDSRFLIVENVFQLKELEAVFEENDRKQAEKIFVIDPEGRDNVPGHFQEKTVFYEELFSVGMEGYKEDPELLDRARKSVQPKDLLTIVYTSGTTGNPKGVMLSHGNLVQNVLANTPRLEIDPAKEEISVVMLPSWHVYERAFEYCAFFAGVAVVYSSPKTFAADLKEEQPHILITVPRIWESIYYKLIKKLSSLPGYKRYMLFFFIKLNQLFLSSRNYLRGGWISLRKRVLFHKFVALAGNSILYVITLPMHHLAERLFTPFRDSVGGRLRGAASAAGALPKYLDELFNSIGIEIVNAYGMTECAPGILSRTFYRNTFGTIGIPFDNVKVEIRREDGSITEIGEKGIIYTSGPQVMKGYYRNPEATKAVLDAEGWLNTGDIGVRLENGEIIIVGRAKDTIVLMGGENVEPEPIEDKIKESIYIDHAVVIGQDRKQLSAVVAVNEEELMNLAAELKVADYEIYTEGKASIEHDRIYSVLMKEVNSLVSREHGFKTFERIAKIIPVKNNFSVGKELTQTLKVKRRYIEEKYRNMIERLHRDTKK